MQAIWFAQERAIFREPLKWGGPRKAAKREEGFPPYRIKRLETAVEVSTTHSKKTTEEPRPEVGKKTIIKLQGENNKASLQGCLYGG